MRKSAAILVYLVILGAPASASAMFCFQLLPGWWKPKAPLAEVLEPVAERVPFEGVPTIAELELPGELAPSDMTFVLPNGSIVKGSPRPKGYYETRQGNRPASVRKGEFTSKINLPDEATANYSKQGDLRYRTLLESFLSKISPSNGRDIADRAVEAALSELRRQAVRSLFEKKVQSPRFAVSEKLMVLLHYPGARVGVRSLSELESLIRSIKGEDFEKGWLIKEVQNLLHTWRNSEDLSRQGNYQAFKSEVDVRFTAPNGIAVDLRTWWGGTYEVLPDGNIKILRTQLLDNRFFHLPGISSGNSSGSSTYSVIVTPPAEGKVPLRVIDGIYASFYDSTVELERPR